MTINSKILFLGTGGGRHTTSTQLRQTGGIVVQIEDSLLWIDPGPGALVYGCKHKIDMQNISHIFISHEHIDHASDINVLIDSMTLGGVRKKGTIICSKTLFHSDVIKNYHKNCVETVKFIEDKTSYSLSDFRIDTFSLKHTIPCYGFKLDTDYYSLGYIADTAYSNKISKDYENCNIIIANITIPNDLKAKGHINTEDLIKIISNMKHKPKLIVITHFDKTMLEADPITQTRKIQQKTGVETLAAQDGMVIDPISFGFKTNQEKISHFEE